MSKVKISINADVALRVLYKANSPLSLREIALQSGDEGVENLQKHQVRQAVEAHLSEHGFVESYKREVQGNEVHYYALTEAGQGRVASSITAPPQSFECECEDRLEDLESRVEANEDQISNITEFINGTLYERFDKVVEDLQRIDEKSCIRLKHYLHDPNDAQQA